MALNDEVYDLAMNYVDPNVKDKKTTLEISMIIIEYVKKTNTSFESVFSLVSKILMYLEPSSSRRSGPAEELGKSMKDNNDLRELYLKICVEKLKQYDKWSEIKNLISLIFDPSQQFGGSEEFARNEELRKVFAEKLKNLFGNAFPSISSEVYDLRASLAWFRINWDEIKEDVMKEFKKEKKKPSEDKITKKVKDKVLEKLKS